MGDRDVGRFCLVEWLVPVSVISGEENFPWRGSRISAVSRGGGRIFGG